MRTAAAALLVVASLASASAARAAEEEQPSAPASHKTTDATPLPQPQVASEELAFDPRFVLDTGRYEYTERASNALSLQFHGEFQLRYRAFTTLPLEPPISDPTATTLGQHEYVYWWLRLGARFQYRRAVGLVFQFDVPRGMLVGDTTQWVDAARESFNEAKWYNVKPRYMYLDANTAIGVFRVGQQGSHWGMGILANDGDHPTLFGDTVGGTITERALFATTPFGKGHPFVVALAGDIVYEDPTAQLYNGDKAFQGVAALAWREKHAEVGVYGVVREQTHQQSATDLTSYTDKIEAGILDVSGRFDAKLPTEHTFLYGETEAAGIFGSTNTFRQNISLDPTQQAPNDSIRSFGAAATVGVVKARQDGDKRWGTIDVEIEGGYASGDADPTDGVQKRFTFDPNHHVGLLIFNQVLNWKTARAATIAADTSLVARPAPGLDLLPSNGGVFGAEYINPRGVYRPVHWLDLKGGVVVAQTSADFVDPYRFSALGQARNYDGGDPKKHDLGIELDLGFDTRVRLDQGTTLQLGAEGGVFFPGHAFDDAAGNHYPTQAMVNAKAGFQY